MAGSHDSSQGSLDAVWLLRNIVDSDDPSAEETALERLSMLREIGCGATGFSGCDAGDGILRDVWSEARNGECDRLKEEEKSVDDEGSPGNGEGEGGMERSWLGRYTNVGRRRKCGGLMATTSPVWQREREGVHKPWSSLSSSHSRLEPALQLAKASDEEGFQSFLLRLRRRFGLVHHPADGNLRSNRDARWDSEAESGSCSRTLLLKCGSQNVDGSIDPRVNLRGGAGAKRLDDDERVPKMIWFFAGGVGRAPTGKGLRDWKEKAQQTERSRTKEKVGFWRKMGVGIGRRGKKQKQKNKGERKEGTDGAWDGGPGAGWGAGGGETNTQGGSAGDGRGTGHDSSGIGSGSSGRTTE